jgi:hypothetical protein
MPMMFGVSCTLPIATVPRGGSKQYGRVLQGRDYGQPACPVREMRDKDTSPRQRQNPAGAELFMAAAGIRRVSMRFLQLLCLAGVLASALTADSIVYDSTGEASAGADGVDFVGPLYDSFTSNAAERITGLQLILSGDNTSTGAVDVGLYADNSTAPGALIATLGVLDDSTLSDMPSLFDITLNAYPLLTDTRYWIGLSGTTSAEWSYDSDSVGFGVATEYFANQIGIFSNASDPYQMSVTEGTPTAPEPVSGLLIAIGIAFLALLAAARHFKRQSAANS